MCIVYHVSRPTSQQEAMSNELGNYKQQKSLSSRDVLFCTRVPKFASEKG